MRERLPPQLDSRGVSGLAERRTPHRYRQRQHSRVPRADTDRGRRRLATPGASRSLTRASPAPSRRRVAVPYNSYVNTPADWRSTSAARSASSQAVSTASPPTQQWATARRNQSAIGDPAQPTRSLTAVPVTLPTSGVRQYPVVRYGARRHEHAPAGAAASPRICAAVAGFRS
jgi:hypothetical protein